MYKNSFTFNLDFPYIFICTHTFYACYCEYPSYPFLSDMIKTE